MIRFTFLTLVTIPMFACSSATQNEATAWHAYSKFDERLCRNEPTDEYLCYMPNDTSKNDIGKLHGYHVIRYIKDERSPPLALVGVGCQHYYCTLETPVLETQSGAPRVKTTNCCFAYRVSAEPR